MYRILLSFTLCSLLSATALSSPIDNFLVRREFKTKHFRAAIRREEDIFRVDANKDTYLHKAVRQNNAKAIRVMADNSPIMRELYKPNAQKLSPMELCITLGNNEAFEALLDKMHIAQFRINNRWGWALIHLVAKHNKPDMIRILAARGLNVNAQDKTGDRWTALDVAYFYNSREVIAVLKSMGARAVAYPEDRVMAPVAAVEVPKPVEVAEDSEESENSEELGADFGFGPAAVCASAIIYTVVLTSQLFSGAGSH